VVAAAGMLAATVTFTARPAAAYPLATVDLVGHGWGHGRGMGQYGAYGYAQAGQPYTWILDHFYGGTTLGAVDPNTPIAVHLSAFDSADTLVQMTNGHLVVSWAGGIVGALSGVRIVHNPDGSLTILTGPSCAGPWTPLAGNLAGTDVTVAPQVPGDDINEMVQGCPPDGSRHWYRGALVAKTGSGQTWNLLGLDQYVRGVVAQEVPASWGTAGGQEALKAQAVAARSYGLSYVQGAGAICDTTCQTYNGRALSKGGVYKDLEGAGIFLTTTDAAVSATTGQVRICTGSPGCPAGTVAHTEYSSSSGGESAGGTFPAVVDNGDATASNPNHSWTASVPVTTIQATFPAIGALQSVTVTQRNTLGDLGGRVLQVQVAGTTGTVTLSGAQFAASLGLRSSWFAVANAVSGPSGGDNGYWLAATDGGVFSFGAAPFLGSTGGLRLNQPIVGMAPTPDQGGYWFVASDGGIFTFGDAGFYGSTGAVRLNRPVRNMAATPSGRGYWLVASDGGIFTFGDAGFYGSTGAIALNQPIVGMAATPSGRGYWLVASDGGIFTFGDAGFYGSTGAVRLSQPIVGMVPSVDGRGYLLVGRDGGIFSFGDAGFQGSLPGRGVNDVIVAVQPTADGGGYEMVSAAGAVYNFGDAPWFGGMAQIVPGYRGTIIGLSAHRGP
jgi:SpoIID/LytB domain protein